jgi:hypothetical protein
MSFFDVYPFYRHNTFFEETLDPEGVVRYNSIGYGSYHACLFSE